MSVTATIPVSSLSAAQSETVRELRTALNEFNSANCISKEKHWKVITKFIELQMEFPEIAEMSKGYYEATESTAWEPTFDGYNESLFWVFLSLRAFAKSTTIGDFNRLHVYLEKYLTELSAFAERAQEPVMVLLVGTSLPNER